MDDTAAVNESVARKLRAAIELQRFGIAMMRQHLVRRFPAESATEIDARLNLKLFRRPEAEHGDAVGRPGSWPRKLR